MRTPLVLVSMLAAAIPVAARAQLANRSISLESGVSSRGEAGAAVVALGASHWLDGDVHLVARLALGDEPGTEGRAAASALAGTVGAAWAPGTGPVRASLLAEVGWVRLSAAGETSSRAALRAGGALEWFVARDVVLRAVLAARRWDAWRPELVAGAVIHF